MELVDALKFFGLVLGISIVAEIMSSIFMAIIIRKRLYELISEMVRK